jgi:hypothetical protein
MNYDIMMDILKTFTLNMNGEAVIASGAALSGEIDVRGFHHLWIRMPATWTAADIALHTSEESGGTFSLLRDKAAAAVLIDGPIAANSYIGLDFLKGLRFIKLASVDVADPTAAQNQAADRTIEYALES